jgi:predicted nucleic acid-binding protein
MKFWDTSAIIPLLVNEQYSDIVDPIFSKDSSMIVWWGTSIECISAISRLERENKITPSEHSQVINQLNELRDSWREIQASPLVKQYAERILQVHPLKAQDAQQLAACLVANQDMSIEFFTFDQRLQIAARKEGLKIEVG